MTTQKTTLTVLKMKAPARAKAPITATPPPPFTVKLSLLATGHGVALTQLSPDALEATIQGEDALLIPGRLVNQDGRSYLECTQSAVTASPAMAAAQAGRYDSRRRNIRVHQLSAIVGRGAKLKDSAPAS